MIDCCETVLTIGNGKWLIIFSHSDSQKRKFSRITAGMAGSKSLPVERQAVILFLFTVGRSKARAKELLISFDGNGRGVSKFTFHAPLDIIT